MVCNRIDSRWLSLISICGVVDGRYPQLIEPRELDISLHCTDFFLFLPHLFLQLLKLLLHRYGEDVLTKHGKVPR
jgi:hypothetical protein